VFPCLSTSIFHDSESVSARACRASEHFPNALGLFHRAIAGYRHEAVISPLAYSVDAAEHEMLQILRQLAESGNECAESGIESLPPYCSFMDFRDNMAGQPEPEIGGRLRKEYCMATIVVNGVKRELQAPADTPLLYVLRNELELSGPQFGCGVAQCGACSVLLDGKEIRSCITPVSVAAGKEVTTLEGLPARWAQQKKLPQATLHPVQEAWIEEQTPLCGFCQNGMMIKATELLERVASPSVTEIKEAFTTSGPSAHLCRCGSYTAIIQAVQRAAATMAKGGRA
jgi:isoquinoline 1-oxidoreductase alpha subunit